MTDLTSRRAVLTAALALASAPLVAQEAFPSRPVRIIVPYGAGSSVDLVTRLLAQRMAAKLGQAVVVENKPGAGTMVGTSLVAKAPADGYTLLLGSNAMSIMPHLYKPDFDPVTDFVPVAPVFNTGIVLVAKPSFPANNLVELAKLAKEKPGKLSYSTWGVGTSAHLVGELYKDKAGIFMLHVPYKGGGIESAGAVITGDVDVGFDTSFTALPRIRSGQVKALGVFYPERIEGMPDVQTAAEAGFGDATLLGWVGLFAPARTPAAVVRVLTAAAQEGMTDPALVARLRSQGSKPFAGAPQVLMDTMRAESDRIKTIVAKKGIKVE